MIILITGASHTGKTLLAQKMLEEYICPYIYFFIVSGNRMDLIGIRHLSLFHIPTSSNQKFSCMKFPLCLNPYASYNLTPIFEAVI